jgi:hypothetical protein
MALEKNKGYEKYGVLDTHHLPPTKSVACPHANNRYESKGLVPLWMLLMLYLAFPLSITV